MNCPSDTLQEKKSSFNLHLFDIISKLNNTAEKRVIVHEGEARDCKI